MGVIKVTKMKYLLKWKTVNPPKTQEERKKAKEDNNRRYTQKKSNEEKHGKVLFPPHLINKFNGFVIIEATKDQLYNRISASIGLEYTITPIIAAPEMGKYIE